MRKIIMGLMSTCILYLFQVKHIQTKIGGRFVGNVREKLFVIPKIGGKTLGKTNITHVADKTKCKFSIRICELSSFAFLYVMFEIGIC